MRWIQIMGEKVLIPSPTEVRVLRALHEEIGTHTVLLGTTGAEEPSLERLVQEGAVYTWTDGRTSVRFYKLTALGAKTLKAWQAFLAVWTAPPRQWQRLLSEDTGPYERYFDPADPDRDFGTVQRSTYFGPVVWLAWKNGAHLLDSPFPSEEAAKAAIEAAYRNDA